MEKPAFPRRLRSRRHDSCGHRLVLHASRTSGHQQNGRHPSGYLVLRDTATDHLDLIEEPANGCYQRHAGPALTKCFETSHIRRTFPGEQGSSHETKHQCAATVRALRGSWLRTRVCTAIGAAVRRQRAVKLESRRLTMAIGEDSHDCDRCSNTGHRRGRAVRRARTVIHEDKLRRTPAYMQCACAARTHS